FSTYLIFDTELMNSFAITVADLNSDNHLDIIVGNSNNPNMVFYNSENGQKWVKKLLSKEKFLTYDIIASDINNDGLIDIIEANSDEINSYYINRIKK
ncbi:MAG: hypothetical protein ACI8WA_001140, partial [Polaribacter sp.]